MSRFGLAFALAISAAALSAQPLSGMRHERQNPRLAGGLSFAASAQASGRGAAEVRSAAPLARFTETGEILVEVRCESWSEATVSALEAAGLAVDHFSARWATAVGTVAAGDLEALAAVKDVAVVRPLTEAMTNVGAVESQGDGWMLGPTARQIFGVDGTGVPIGVISDTFFDPATTGGTLTDGVLIGSNPQNSGDLPPTVRILSNGTNGIEEGAAMAELIHDTAPGSPLFFHTGTRSQVDFADGILALHSSGCRVITDDVFWFEEPEFQDGFIAQAINEVVAAGGSYFSSAGNQGRTGVLDTYRDINPLVNPEEEFEVSGNEIHDWTGTGVGFARISIPGGFRVRIVAQWSEPHSGSLGPGSQADYDIYLVDAPSINSNAVARSISEQGTIGAPAGDPIELLDYTHSGEETDDFYLVLNRYAGRRDVTFRIFWIVQRAEATAAGSVTVDGAIFNDAQIHGHHVGMGSSVAAVYFKEIETGGNIHEIPNRIDVEPFSSLGGNLPHFYDGSGNPLPGAPVNFFEPDFAAPDGTNTTFFGSDTGDDADTFPNFFGTSAAAPHAAAAAALLYDRARRAGTVLRGNHVYDILAQTANSAIQDPGRDVLSGFGLINALAAVGRVLPSAGQIEADLTGSVPLPYIDLNGDGRDDVADLVRRVNIGP